MANCEWGGDSAELNELVRPLTHERLLDTCDLIEQLRRYLTMNVNPQLIFERLLVHLQQTLSGAVAARPA